MENVAIKKPDDFVIATGKSYTIKHFLDLSLKKLDFKYKWIGKGLEMKCIDLQSGKIIIKINKNTLDQQRFIIFMVTIKKLKLTKWSPKTNLKTYRYNV